MRVITAFMATISVAVSPIPFTHSEAPTASSTVATTATTIMATPVDPVQHLPRSVQQTIECIAYVESRSTPGRPHLVDTSYAGAEGMYQIMPEEWRLFRSESGYRGIPFTPNEANLLQQDQAIVWFYGRNGGFRPEWTGDFSCRI